MSKFKNVVKATLKDFKALYTNEWNEFGNAHQFYKQSFRDFVYATKLLLIGLLGILCLVCAPLLLPVAITMRISRTSTTAL